MSLLGVGVSKLAGLDTTIRQVAHPFSHPNLDKSVVQCIAFDTLLYRHEVRQIDLLQVDVEGYDFEIIKLVNFHRIRPNLIRYEHRAP